MAKILVLDGDSAAALAITRSAGRAGHEVAVGAHRGAFAAAQLSRYCRARLEYPLATEAAREFVEVVLRYVRDHPVDLVIPVTDRTLGPLSKYREQFTAICRAAMPLHNAMELVSDKFRTIELARSLGIQVPRTRLLRSAEELSQSGEFQLPLVVKDRFSIRWIDDVARTGKTSYAYSAAEAHSRIDERIRDAGDVLIQEFVPGTGTGFSCFVIDGKTYLPFQWERVREADPRGSASSARKSVPLEKSIAYRARNYWLGWASKASRWWSTSGLLTAILY